LVFAVVVIDAVEKYEVDISESRRYFDQSRVENRL